jgi:hypothetical protein
MFCIDTPCVLWRSPTAFQLFSIKQALNSALLGVLIAGCAHVQNVDPAYDDLSILNTNIRDRTVNLEFVDDNKISAKNVSVRPDSISFYPVVVRRDRPGLEFIPEQRRQTATIQSIRISSTPRVATRGMIIGFALGASFGGLITYSLAKNGIFGEGGGSIGADERMSIAKYALIFGAIGAALGAVGGSLFGRSDTYRFQTKP